METFFPLHAVSRGGVFCRDVAGASLALRQGSAEAPTEFSLSALLGVLLGVALGVACGVTLRGAPCDGVLCNDLLVALAVLLGVAFEAMRGVLPGSSIPATPREGVLFIGVCASCRVHASIPLDSFASRQGGSAKTPAVVPLSAPLGVFLGVAFGVPWGVTVTGSPQVPPPPRGGILLGGVRDPIRAHVSVAMASLSSRREVFTEPSIG